MIIFLSDLQKEHLKIIQDRSVQVLVDFCKLAIDYINNGVNQRKCALAAGKLHCSTTDIENVIYALVCLLVDGCRHNINEIDFKSSLAIAGFKDEQQDILAKLYSTKSIEISQCLRLIQPKDQVYQDLGWRLEVEVVTKGGGQELKPSVLLSLVLAKSKSASEREYTNKGYVYKETAHSILPSNFSIESAQTASQCQHIVSNLLLKSDLPNLLNVTNKLEQALKESKSQHVRKVQRSLT